MNLYSLFINVFWIITNLIIYWTTRNLNCATNPLERDKLMPSWSSDVSWDTRITNWNFEWPPRGIGLRGVALYHSIITPFRCVTFTRGPKYSLHRAGQSRGRAKMMRKTYVAFWALHINAWLFFCSFDQELAELWKLNSIKVQILFGTRNGDCMQVID